MKRRAFLQQAAGLTLLGWAEQRPSAAAQAARVVVVGGGFGGATAARYLKKLAPEIQVTLVEPQTRYLTCPTSSWVISGQRELKDLVQHYDNLEKIGVKLIAQKAERLIPQRRILVLDDRSVVGYDRLIVAPGIDFRWDAIEGYTAAVAETVPHAWKAGAQTLLLKRQLEAMPDGGLVIISVPDNPYRCPPGPYERASLIAYYLQKNKPKSKVIILDAKEAFSKQSAFIAGWERHYRYGQANAILEWVPYSADGAMRRFDPKTNTLYGEFSQFRGQVINIIPPQRAPEFLTQWALTDSSGFCPVTPLTFESTLIPKVHVIGDAARADPLPKSAHSANSQGKVCAAALANLLRNQTPPEPHWVNTCYSLITPHYGISVVGMFKLHKDRIYSISGTGGVSNPQSSRAWEATYARSWYRYITYDTFG